jgi:hypothetical protein
VTEKPEIMQVPISFENYEKWQRLLKELGNSPNLDPSTAITTEWKTTVDYGDGITVVSILDRVDELREGHYRIVDYKTGGFQTESGVAKDLQLRMYAANLWLMWGDDIESLTVATHILTSDDLVEAQITLQEIQETIEYVKMIGKRMFADDKLQANPGDACTQYGGCWGAHACKEHAQTKIATRDATIDLATASDGDLGKWYTACEYFRTMIQGAMKERLKTGTAEIVYGSNRYFLKPATKKTVDADKLHRMFNQFSEYGFTPVAVMNVDFRRLNKILKETEAAIMDDVRTSLNNRVMLSQALWDMADQLYSEELSGERFTRETVKEEDVVW